MGLDRIEADEPLERTAARSIPKPCLEAGHRIVPTCQPVHVGSDRTDRSSVLSLDCTLSDNQFPAGGFHATPLVSRNHLDVIWRACLASDSTSRARLDRAGELVSLDGSLLHSADRAYDEVVMGRAWRRFASNQPKV